MTLFAIFGLGGFADFPLRKGHRDERDGEEEEFGLGNTNPTGVGLAIATVVKSQQSRALYSTSTQALRVVLSTQVPKLG